MSTIEYYGEQLDNKEVFLKQVIEAYQKVVPNACPCKHCKKRYLKTFDKWNPVENYNHAWKIVDLLGHFGYTGYDYDSVLYTFTLHCPKCANHGDLKYEGNGLNFGQAVCNALITFASEYEFAPEIIK